MNIRPADHFDFPEIIEILEEIHLDMEDIEPDQFVVGLVDEAVVGAGRILQHDDALELCSVGVLSEHRGKGIGKGIVEMLLNLNSNEKLFVVTDIPDFFRKFGFVECSGFPESIQVKRQKCLDELDCKSAIVMLKES